MIRYLIECDSTEKVVHQLCEISKQETEIISANVFAVTLVAEDDDINRIKNINGVNRVSRLSVV